MTPPTTLEDLIHEFEADGGHVPDVTPAVDLYAAFRDWAERSGKPVPSLHAFARRLARHDLLPCRLPDGSLAFVGICLKTTRQGRRAQ